MTDTSTITWYFYLLRCCDNSLYAGVTTDLERRLRQHNAGRGAKYTRLKRPVNLAYWEACKNKSAAFRREAEVKRWPKLQKEALALGQPSPQDVQLWHVGRAVTPPPAAAAASDAPELDGLSRDERDRV